MGQRLKTVVKILKLLLLGLVIRSLCILVILEEVIVDRILLMGRLAVAAMVVQMARSILGTVAVGSFVLLVLGNACFHLGLVVMGLVIVVIKVLDLGVVSTLRRPELELEEFNVVWDLGRGSSDTEKVAQRKLDFRSLETVVAIHLDTEGAVGVDNLYLGSSTPVPIPDVAMAEGKALDIVVNRVILGSVIEVTTKLSHLQIISNLNGFAVVSSRHLPHCGCCR